MRRPDTQPIAGFHRLEELEPLATGRNKSLFAGDMNDHVDQIRERLAGRRVLVIGAAGSIGSALVRLLAEWDLTALAIVDLSENNLVELVRDLRATPGLALPNNFQALPIGLGSTEMDRWINEVPPFDYLFNLAAMKHVRSEKDIYSITRMIDTNVAQLHSLLENLPYRLEKLFSVSSDKAVNPANLMGATKMAMEQVLLAHADRHPFTTARFANVAFSDGSLPQGFLRRIAKRQPLVAPNDVKRYFISHREAAELCLLACLLGDNRDAFFPQPTGGLRETRFTDIAVALLASLGFEPLLCNSDEEAKSRARGSIPRGLWPCRFTPSITSGEKPYEEFFTDEDLLDEKRFRAIGIIKRGVDSTTDRAELEAFLSFAQRLKTDPQLGKGDVVRQLSELVTGLEHVETGEHLDERM